MYARTQYNSCPSEPIIEACNYGLFPYQLIFLCKQLWSRKFQLIEFGIWNEREDLYFSYQLIFFNKVYTDWILYFYVMVREKF